MKLNSALSVYGLLPSDDFMRVEELEAFSEDELLRRVVRTGTRICNKYLATMPVIFELSGPVPHPESGVRWTIHGHRRNYTWDVTESERVAHGWTCGLVEAMFRRYALSALVPHGIDTLLPIPETHDGWA